MAEQTTPPPLSDEQIGRIAARLGTARRHLDVTEGMELEDAGPFYRALADSRTLLAEVERLRARVAELVEQRDDALVDIATGDVPEANDGPQAPRCGRARATGQPCPDHSPIDVIELTWRPQDILLGDDDTADLMLTTKDGRPANWRLDPDQRRALADDLAPESAETVEEWGVRNPRDPEFIAPQSEREHAEAELKRAHHFGIAAELVTRTATYGDWQPVEDGGDDR